MSPDPKPTHGMVAVSVLFNEPKLLKLAIEKMAKDYRFSALQRAEIAEIFITSTLTAVRTCFSALQRAEIAEIRSATLRTGETSKVSVLFNEPKLLKLYITQLVSEQVVGFSALQRAEIAEMAIEKMAKDYLEKVSVLFNEPKLLKFSPMRIKPRFFPQFQCSSTSRNC